ncbi:MAG: arsenate reductase ArsC [Deltaproteobacteria bacterium]|nr:arsenate reductase ArsC [Deltaproteobacteria bacterium]
MKILFVCEYNACRSQMAEGLARTLLPNSFSIMSAGLYPGELNPITIEVMKEIGIDISHQRSKLLVEVKDKRFDRVVVLAEPAWKAIEMLNADHKLLWPFPDPASDPGDVETVKGRIRTVRDQLKERILTL